MKTARILPTVSGILVLLVLIPQALAKVQNPAYRSCMQQAVSVYQTSIIGHQRTYHQQLEAAMEQRRQAYTDAWNNEDDKDISAANRAADRAYNDQTRAARRQKTDSDRAANTRLTEERRNCYPLKSSSSSSSSSSPQPPNCRPIVCFDGRQFPTCTPDGKGVIDYFQDPCQTNACGQCPSGFQCVCKSPCPPTAEVCVMSCVMQCERM